jgi:hypothetical protein
MPGTCANGTDGLDAVLKEILPNLLGGPGHALSAVSMSFITEPMVYHAMHWVAAVHTDSLSHQAQWTTHASVLTHLARTFTMLRDNVGSLRAADHETTLLTVLCLTKCDLKPEDVEKRPVSLFVPHLPMSNWASIHGIAQHVQ